MVALVVVLGVVVAGLYAGSRKAGRWPGVAAASVLLAGAVLCGLFALVLAGMTCDEGCDRSLDSGSPPWSEDPDAWQWWGQFALAAAASAPAVLSLRGAVAGHGNAELRWGLVSATLLAGWALWLWVAL